MSENQTLRMVLPQTELSAFFPLLQLGVWFRSQVGCSVSSLLTEQFGIEENYIIERITTLFMDCKPIDDVNTSYVKDGSTLALSSAMPGLVGATMRRGGHLAAMRGEISHQSQQQGLAGSGRVKIKLFNMVMTELGAKFLSYGFCLSNCELLSFLDEQEGNFLPSSTGIILGDQQIDSSKLKKTVSQADPAGEIIFMVEFVD